MWFTSSYSGPNGQCVQCRWVKSTHSADQGNCLEWRTSRHSAYNGSCVEAANGILVRDSQLGDASAVLSFTPRAWARFTSALK
jgi:uncharacterized protein DUF397